MQTSCKSVGFSPIAQSMYFVNVCSSAENDSESDDVMIDQCNLPSSVCEKIRSVSKSWKRYCFVDLSGRIPCITS